MLWCCLLLPMPIFFQGNTRLCRGCRGRPHSNGQVCTTKLPPSDEAGLDMGNIGKLRCQGGQNTSLLRFSKQLSYLSWP